LSRDANTDAIDAHDGTYSIVYPNDDCTGDEKEIMQLVKNHERIVNDPRFVEFKCCS
jgi:hypothetical protein